MKFPVFTASALLVMAVATPVAANDCLICDQQVVLDDKLAACFLDRYETLQTIGGNAIAVDLTDCPEVAANDEEQDRGVVAALKPPSLAPALPDPTFMITRSQLSCLRNRLADETLILDPAAEIALDDCE
ncbi:MAG: hypothetical protein AB3N20_06010 [Rhizobiaceae bacterium]